MNKNECLDVSVLQTLGMTLLVIFQLYRVFFELLFTVPSVVFHVFFVEPNLPTVNADARVAPP